MVIINFIISILIIMVMIVAESVRGGLLDKPWAYGGTIIMGWLTALLCGHPWDWSAAVCIALMLAGRAPGWGHPVGMIIDGKPRAGSPPEWWQLGPLPDHPWWSMWVRGAMWGGVVAIMGYHDPAYLAALWLIPILPASLWLAKQIAFHRNDTWGLMHSILGGLFAVALIITGIFIT